MGLSREKASELLESIPPERIEKIESEKSLPRADEVLIMAGKYKKPTLRNFYCSQQCSIGRQYVPRVEIKELSSIVLEMLASLNSVGRMKDRLVEIAADGKIDNDEIRPDQGHKAGTGGGRTYNLSHDPTLLCQGAGDHQQGRRSC